MIICQVDETKIDDREAYPVKIELKKIAKGGVETKETVDAKVRYHNHSS